MENNFEITSTNKSFIVDSHCHLDLIEEKGINLETILQTCQSHNVKILQTVCTRISQIDKILAYSTKHPAIYASVGVHPCNVVEEGVVESAEIIKICQENSKIIGIGETGLDYFHDTSSITQQTESFLKHIEASKVTNLPTIIHSRNADKDMAEILKSEQKSKEFPALLHCFSSSKELAQQAIDLGVYISISGIVTFKNAAELQEIVKYVPLEYLLVETDSPYLAPNPHRGKINQPAFTSFVVDFIAQLKGLTSEEVAQKTSENFLKIFTKVQI